MRATSIARPHPSRGAHARSTLRERLRMRAPQDEDSIAFRPSSRCQTAHLVPAAHCVRPGFATLLHSPRVEGWAERRETFGCSAEHPWGLPSCVKDARERAYDAARQALARRLTSHDAGRSPLGAPPWRFWAPGAALPSPSVPTTAGIRLRIRAASSSQPGRSAWRATSRASRGERLRAARRRTPRLAPPSGSSLEDAPR